MKRISLGLAVLLCSFSLVLACNQPPDSFNGDGGTVTDGGNGGTTDGGITDGGTNDGGTNDGGTTDGGTTDGGTPTVVGTVTGNSTGNALPASWAVNDASVFASDGNGTGAKAHQDVLVTLNVATTVVATPADGAANCALPYKTYCDSMTVKDASGNQVVLDTFSFLGAHPTGCTLPADNASIAKISGIWEAHYDSTSKTTTWAIALTDCSSIGLASPPYTGTKQPTLTQDIANLKANGLKSGPSGSVTGVVIATWHANTAWGFTMEDPDGGAGIAVKWSSSSASTASEPSVGDDVTVTGNVVAIADEIKL